MTDNLPKTLGVLLAGGLARRMGGGDKPMRTIGGRTIMERVIARVAPQCDQLVLNANGDPSRFATFGLPVVADNIEGFVGPLAGVLAALDWTAENRPDIEWLLSTATDCPFLPRDLVKRLHQAQAVVGSQIAVAASGRHVHHVVALWNISLRNDLRDALVKEDIRKVGFWMSRYKPATVTWPDTPLDPFFNANTIEDIVEAERLAKLDERAQ